MGLRTIGRWLYHAITSAEKRPYIELNIESLELLTAQAASSRDIILLFNVLDELTYRKSTPARRDELAKKITSLLKEFGDVNIVPKAEREKIAKARNDYLAQADLKAAEEKRRKLNEARSKREAEAKAQRAEEERTKAAEKAGLEAEAKAKREEAARKEAERKAKAAAAEKARLEAKEKAEQEAERKAQEAATEKARQEAEAKAQREAAERKEAERKAQAAAAEKARLEAKEKAKQEAERKAQEAAAEKARLEAEAKAKREAAARKEAERKAKEAASEQARLEAEEKARLEAERKAKEAAAEKARLEAEEKAQREAEEKASAEAEQKAKEKAEQARLEAERRIQQEVAAEQARQEAEAKAGEEAERKAQEEAAGEQARVEAEVRLTPGQDPNASRQLEERAEADARSDAASKSFSQTPPAKGVTRRVSREEENEERRELARLRWLERNGKAANQSEDELVEADLDAEVEPAEQFAPFLRAIPAHWSDWSEQHWNIKLLDYCFVQKADENSGQGIPSTEEDLAFITGDRESSPADIAQALVDRVREFSVNHGLSPARLLIKRLETWDHKSPSPPRYFAFLWTTCLIAQGFPSPFEQGEFHRRYERDDVCGANESQFLSGNLPAAWEQLSKWLDRDDIFDAQTHRRLILPKTDSRRSIISHSWKLSFPCRSDRKRLHDLLGRVREGHTSPASADLELISRLHYQGRFTPEFTAALKQQIDLVQRGNQVEEWLSAIIQREIEARGISQAESGRNGRPRELSGISPKVMLHLDDEDCYLELVLPGQSIAIEKPRRLSYKTYCAINLEAKDKLPQVVGELDIDEKQEDVIIPELRVKIESEDEEYVLRLRHEGLDNAVLAEWSCEGLPSNKPYILFDSETNQIINDGALIGNSLSLLFRRDWDVALSDGIEAETEEPRRVSRLGGWRHLEFAKTSPPEKSETISLTNVTGEECEVCWVEPCAGNSNSRPLLKGLGLPGQANGFVMLAESPELWLPPAVTDAQIKIYKIEDDEFFMPIGSIQVPSTEVWQRAEVRKLITCPGLYSVRLSYFEDSSDKPRKWSRQIFIAEEPDIKSLRPRSLQARHSYKGVETALDLERGVEPLAISMSKEFWNATWRIHGLWSYEQLLVRLTGDISSFSQKLSADSAGKCEIPIAAFEASLNAGQSIRLSIKRKGFGHQYDLAYLIETPTSEDAGTQVDTKNTVETSPRRSIPRGKAVNRLELFYDSTKVSRAREMSYNRAQELLRLEVTNKIERDFDDVTTEVREGLNGIGGPKRMVFLTMDFPGIDRDDKKALEGMVHQLIGSIKERTGTYFYAEWSRARE